MKIRNIEKILHNHFEWDRYDLIFLASGFKSRSTYILDAIPSGNEERVVVLGFPDDLEKLSRPLNDDRYRARGLNPILEQSELAYEDRIKGRLFGAALFAGEGRIARILVDYSVMTRAWYGYILTWLRYAPLSSGVDVDFIYSHGLYQSEFDPLHIRTISAIPGFEGSCAGPRQTVAFFGLGFDRYATLAVHEQVEPDDVVCYIAEDYPNDPHARRVMEENSEILSISGRPPVKIPLGNLQEIFRLLHEQFNSVDSSDEIIAIPMGPKPHVLATLLVAQCLPRITCLHAKGSRLEPVQVEASGKVSSWRVSYR